MNPSKEPQTLIALWSRKKAQCRGLGGIISDARAGRLPGVVPLPSGFGFEITDEAAALGAMVQRKESKQ